MRTLSSTSVFPLILALAGAIALSGCSDMNRQQQRTVSGAAIGAGVGAGATVLTGGNVAAGTAVGAVVGAGAGYVYDKVDDK